MPGARFPALVAAACALAIASLVLLWPGEWGEDEGAGTFRLRLEPGETLSREIVARQTGFRAGTLTVVTDSDGGAEFYPGRTAVALSWSLRQSDNSETVSSGEAEVPFPANSDQLIGHVFLSHYIEEPGTPLVLQVRIEVVDPNIAGLTARIDFDGPPYGELRRGGMRLVLGLLSLIGLFGAAMAGLRAAQGARRG